MRAIEFIRGILDLIDNLEQKGEQPVTDYEDEVSEPMDQSDEYSNSPDELYVSSNTILSVGNDINKPKHPSDLRTDSFSLYPNAQYNPKR